MSTIIDALDRKILYYLDQNSRESASKIAKKCRVHKNVVNFRIKRLVERGIIRQFVAMISPTTIGLTPYKFYFQLENLTGEKEKQITALLVDLPVYWAARVSGRWDFIIGILAKDNRDVNQIKLKILKVLGKDITKRSISQLIEAPHYNRTYLLDKKETLPTKYWITQKNYSAINENDRKILKILADNSRTPVTEIAQKTNLSVKTIIGKIKKLEKEKIIYDYRISINLEKIGYRFFKCFITLKEGKKELLNKFFEYCKQHKNIIHLVECLGDWDLEPEFEIEDSEKYNQTLEEIRNKFNDLIKTIETINILKEYSYICIPK